MLIEVIFDIITATTAIIIAITTAIITKLIEIFKILQKRETKKYLNGCIFTLACNWVVVIWIRYKFGPYREIIWEIL